MFEHLSNNQSIVESGSSDFCKIGFIKGLMMRGEFSRLFVSAGISFALSNIQLANADILLGIAEDPIQALTEVRSEGNVSIKIEACAKLVAVECSNKREEAEALVRQLNERGKKCSVLSNHSINADDGYCFWSVTSQDGQEISRVLKPFCYVDFWPSCQKAPPRQIF